LLIVIILLFIIVKLGKQSI